MDKDLKKNIKIKLNGKEQEFAADITISDLLELKKIRPETCTVELNEKIIPRNDYPSTILHDGDVLEIVFFIGGGSSTVNKNLQKSGGAVAPNILSLIFNTPLVKINRIISDEKLDGEIFAKLESYSPGGSIKDRIALSMIEDAEKKGLIKPDTTIVEPTSGNTGIGIALVCAVKGYKCILTMPESMSLERIYILKNFGAQIVLTPAVEGMQGAVAKAKEIVSKNKNAILLEQFNNPANPEIHRRTTAQEIINAFPGGASDIDAFVAGVGTGGTITGVGGILKSKNPSIKVIAVEPASSPVLSGGKAGAHKIQGIGAGFIPSVLDKKIIDEIITVRDEDAYFWAKQIAMKEGIFCGISSGAALAASVNYLRKNGAEKKIVTIFPDTGERYFSVQQYFEI